MEPVDHIIEPVVPLEAEIEALVYRLSELAGADACAFLDKLKIKLRVRNHVQRDNGLN